LYLFSSFVHTCIWRSSFVALLISRASGAACRPHSASTQLTAFYYLPNTVDTSMLLVDICHLKQTVLIRSSTKCKYESGQPQRAPRKTHYTRQNKVCSTLLAQSRVFLLHNMPNALCILPEMRQLQNKPRLNAFQSPPLWFGGLHSWWGVWPKGSSDECESAATDVHTQFLGLNLSLLKNCVWTISR